MAPKPFAPTDRGPEKRTHGYTLRLTNTEREILEAEAAKAGVTPMNLIRRILSEALLSRSNPKT